MLPESVVSDRGPQFVVELTKELNWMLEIKIKLSTAFYPQTDGQIEQMNQELEQYLWFFVNHLLRLMPLGNNEDLGKEYDDMIGCATCSLSQRLMQ